MRPQHNGVLETCLYVADAARSARFYREIFGLETVGDFQERGCALHAGNSRLLLLFKKGASRAIQSPHDGDGELHLAFAIPTSEYDAWKSWLDKNAIELEEEKVWERGGRSIYFRDPDRHLLEVATPGTWTVY